MRVCLVSTCYRPVPLDGGGGAIETLVLGLARGVAALGQEVHVVTLADGHGPGRRERDGVHFHPVTLSGACRGAPHPVRLLLDNIEFGRRASRICKEIRPDVVHYHTPYPCYLDLERSPRRRGTWAVLYHAHNWKLFERRLHRPLGYRWMAAWLGDRVQRRLVRDCDHVITISDFMKQSICRTAGIPADRVSVVPNCVDLEIFAPDPGMEKDCDILFVGRLALEKGLAVLIQAMALVRVSFPHARLMVIGTESAGTERGAYARSCKARVRRLGLDQNVRFFGEIANREVAGWIKKSRVLVVPSLCREPFGLAALEGLACGVPVIASRIGALPEIVLDGQTGILVEPGDPEALSGAILRCLRDTGLSRSAASRGPGFAAAHHSSSQSAARLLEIYGRVTGQGSPPAGSDSH